MTRRLVNNTADEFDELAKLAWREDSSVDDWQAYNKKEKELIKKTFADLAYIFDELYWKYISVLHFKKMSSIICVIFLREEVLAMKLRRQDLTTAKTLINKGTWGLLFEVA